MNFYQHHIGDFNNATRHCDRIERSVYRDLIDLYYETEAPLCDDIAKLARRILAHSEAEKVALATILDEFFTLEDDGYHNERCDEELAKLYEKSEKARVSAQIRWSKKDKKKDRNEPASQSQLQSQCDDDANAMLPNNPLPITQLPIAQSQKAPARFDEFWLAYPHKKDKKKASDCWKRKRLDAKADQIITDVKIRQKEDRQWLDGFIPYASTYLNGERWEDEIEKPKQRGFEQQPKQRTLGEFPV